MLRISYTSIDSEQRWTLCGQLAGPWVEELRLCWEKGRSLNGSGHAVVDLSDVTFIDEGGERLLSEMRKGGVKFVAAGVATKHLLDNLKGKGERPLRRVIDSHGSLLRQGCDKAQMIRNKTNGEKNEESV